MVVGVDCHIMQWSVTQQKITNTGAHRENISEICEIKLPSKSSIQMS